MALETLLLFAMVGILIVAVGGLYARFLRAPQEDPRLSRGLQLLQSKISVLEDLSDRTDAQVKQLTKLLETKISQIQAKIQEAETQISRVESSMEKSREVASIFQDKIPHDEIVERKNTIKYIQAAKMAHKGHSVDEILAKLDLPRAEAEFIAKVNRQQLMFDESQLPVWAKSDLSRIESISPAQSLSEKPGLPSIEQALSIPSNTYESLKKLGDEFRLACREFEAQNPQIKGALEQSSKIAEDTNKVLRGEESKTESTMSPNFAKAIEAPKSFQAPVSNQVQEGTMVEVQQEHRRIQVNSRDIYKVQFPKIDMNDSLG